MTKKIIWCFLVALITISGCKHSNTPEKPKNLIPEDKMVNVLIDLSLLSSAKGLNKKIIENNGITPDEYVYQKHNIDSLQFSESNTYYSYFVDDYSNIYVRVKDSLEKLKRKYTRLEQSENKIEKTPNIDNKKRIKRDSLRIIKKDSLLDPPSFEDN